MLIGREREVGRIEELLKRVCSGDGAVARLEGEAGIGKTTLSATAAQRASTHGFCVLGGAGAQLEREYPFGVVRQLYWPVVAPGRVAGQVLEGAAGLAALPLGLADPRTEQASGGGDAVSAAMHGLYWLTANLAGRAPLLLAVADAHWADDMSRRFVLYLARRIGDLPVLLLVARRPAAEQSDAGLLARLGLLPGSCWFRPAVETISGSSARHQHPGARSHRRRHRNAPLSDPNLRRIQCQNRPPRPSAIPVRASTGGYR